MQDNYPVHNPGKNAMYVAGTMIPSGETRHFSLEQLPVYLRPAPASPEPVAPVDPLAELLEKSVKAIVEAFPGLSDEDFTRLGEMEYAKGDEARKTLLAALSEEALKRADAMTAAAAAAGAGAGDGGQ